MFRITLFDDNFKIFFATYCSVKNTIPLSTKLNFPREKLFPDLKIRSRNDYF